MERRDLPKGIRFVTFSCHNRLPLPRNPAIADLFVERLLACRAKFNTRLLAYVVMPEHAHLLLQPQSGDVSSLLHSLKLSVSRRVVARWRELNAPILKQIATPDGPRFWLKGGGFDRNVRGDTEFSEEVRYIHQNPVERGLVSRAADWKWSSIHAWLARHNREPASSFAAIDSVPGRSDWVFWRGFMRWDD